MSDLVTLGHIKISSVTVPSVLRGLGDASVLGIMSALTRLACLCAVSHEVAYRAVGTLSFPLCLTVRVRIGKPPTAANPGKIDEAPTAFDLQLGDWGQHGRGGNPSGKGGGELCRSDCVEPSHCNSAYIIQACWWEKGGGARDCLAGFNNRWKFEESRGPSGKV